MRRLALPAVVVLFALVPRLWHLDQRPFWYDEVLTVQRASLPLHWLVIDSFSQHHTPFYFLLVAPFTRAHDLQFWMRFPSAIFGALCVTLVYLIAKRVAGCCAGIAAALILGLSPVQIAYAQEARSYTLEMCLVLIALHGLVGLVLAGEGAGLAWRHRHAPRRDWLAFIIGTTLAACTLGDSLPWLLAADASAAMAAWRMHGRAAIMRNFLRANGIILAVCSPLYGVIFHEEHGPILKNFGFVPKPAAALIWNEIESVYLMRICDFMTMQCMAVPTPAVLEWMIGAGLAVAAAAGIWRLRKQPPLLTTLLLAVLILPVCFGVISIWRPMLVTRYILWSASPFAVIAGAGAASCFDRLRRTAGVLTGGAATLLLVTNLVPFYGAETKPRWDIAAAILAAQAKPGAVAYLSQPVSGWTLRYYLPARLQNPLINAGIGDLPHAIQAHAQGQQVWAIFGGGLHTTMAGSLPEFRASLTPLGRPAEMELAGMRITIWRFDP